MRIAKINGVGCGAYCTSSPVTAEVIAAHGGLSRSAAHTELEGLESSGLVTQRAGLWRLTADGRAVHAERCAAELAAAGGEDQIAAYRDFQPVNRDFLEVWTAWQLRTVAGRDLGNRHAYRADRKMILPGHRPPAE